MRVPDDVEVVARREELIRVGLFEEQELNVAFHGVGEELRRRVVGQ